MPPEGIVLLEIGATILVALVFFGIVYWRGGRTMPVWEVGVFYVAIVLLYTVVPMAIILFRYRSGMSLTNGRLIETGFGMEDVAVLGVFSLAYISAFSFGYLMVRGQGLSRLPLNGDWGKAPIASIVICFVVARLIVTVMNYLYGVSAGTYMESYVAIDRMPLLAKQLYSHADAGSVVLVVMLMGYGFAHNKRYKYLLAIVGLYILASAFYVKESRFVLMLFFVVCICHYNRLVKKLSATKAVFVCSAILVAFVAVGYLRGNGGENSSLSGGEFEAVFVNGLDMQMKQKDGFVDLPKWAVLFNPIANIIPQQFLPFQKVVFSNWYVETFYSAYKDSGGGLAFGALAEAMIGFGLTGLIVRAILLGLLFGVVHRLSSRAGVGFVGWCFYTWFMVIAYQCFRDNSGAMLVYLVHMWIPAAGAVYLTDRIIKGLRRNRKPSDRAGCGDPVLTWKGFSRGGHSSSLCCKAEARHDMRR